MEGTNLRSSKANLSEPTPAAYLVTMSVVETSLKLERRAGKFAATGYAPKAAAPEARAAAGTGITTARPDLDQETRADSDSALDPGYLVIVWNDPVNLMTYVTHVFMKVFGWNKQKAEKHMLQVHEQGKSAVARESLEKAEFYVHQLQKYSLHATMEADQ